jgi:hypothetical protein
MAGPSLCLLACEYYVCIGVVFEPQKGAGLNPLVAHTEINQTKPGRNIFSHIILQMKDMRLEITNLGGRGAKERQRTPGEVGMGAATGREGRRGSQMEYQARGCG